MHLTKIEITGYRGFETKQELNFACPTGNEGSGLTVITGPNNSGKSSILEALNTYNTSENLSFSSELRNPAFPIWPRQFHDEERRL
ncbi:AAA family ATPase [Rhabdaerophilum sp.]|uniref:AAA family ATPase n=1 Tax=Rhabdaerophilum sp. TaxID=2717341 RepID=UPI0038D3DFF7